MIFVITYLVIGLVFLMLVVTFGNLIGKCKEKGCSTISIIIGCIMVVAAWPHFAYIAIKAYLSND